MKSIKDQVIKVFGSEVEYLGPLPTGFGIHVRFTNQQDLKRLLIRTGRDNYGYPKYAAPDLFPLVHRHGLIVVDNAVLSGESNVITTGSNHELGKLGAQDLWHLDTEGDGGFIGTVTALRKNDPDAERRNPTLYAWESAIKHSTGKIDPDVFDVRGKRKDALCAALTRMASPEYRFTDTYVERYERSVVAELAPTLVAETIKFMGPDSLFSAEWRRGEPRVLLHSNKIDSGVNMNKDGIRHARVHGDEKEIDPLSGMAIFPV